MHNTTLASSVGLLANANELAQHITQELMGTQVSNTLGNSPVTRDMIYQLTQSRIRLNLSRFTQGASDDQ